MFKLKADMAQKTVVMFLMVVKYIKLREFCFCSEKASHEEAIEVFQGRCIISTSRYVHRCMSYAVMFVRVCLNEWEM